MTERSRFWNGTTTGDATVAPYDADTEFAQVLMSISGANATPSSRSGVFIDELNGLLATGGTSPVVVQSGRAIVYGTWYESDASVNVTIPTPSASTRIDRIVARKDWAGQTVRLVRIAGAEGGAAPAVVQTPGTTWDLPLWQVSVTTGGIITITDERVFLQEIESNNLFGDGSDGDVVVTTTITLTRDMYYNNLTLNSPGIINTGGYRVFVKNVLTIGASAAIGQIGINGGSGAGAAPGSAANSSRVGMTYLSSGCGGGGAGTNGPGSPGGNINSTTVLTGTTYQSTHGANGGNGGAGGSGAGANGAGGTATAAAAFRYRHLALHLLATPGGVATAGAFFHPLYGGTGGAGGGGGGANTGDMAGGGGAGGLAGGIVQIYAKRIANAGLIWAFGGNGGNGGNATVGNAGGGGGGGGGSGGTIYLVYTGYTGAGVILVNGGTGGTGGTGLGSGTSGANGSNGAAGQAIQYNITSKTWSIS